MKLFFSALALAVALSAQAGPMGFKDSTMAMGDFSPNWQEGWLNHAVTPRDAFGAGGVYMRSDSKRLTREFAELSYTRLLHRINGEHSQANLWFIGGVGPIRGNDFAGSKTMFAPGISADYETTRVYVSGTVRLYRAPGIKHDYASVRTGFSFYEVDYDEIQPWFIVEARRMRGLSEKTEITPMLRLIHKSYFVELGINNMKQGRFNFMYIF
ncbi:MAG TPA: hypothetical protein VE934_06730 [Polaromonas sp.]|uniref:hypothetical protein n=1 Tax=Polaromonas sp. TaxID=1869339 RepID=UPI002D6E3E46|nr:hypothetical protein [Polaromonas sp.]HYW56635.1 hypothetical protein [Polaromonas sp.]